MAKIPHQTTISVRVYHETCERLPSGQSNGKPVENGKESFVFTVTGNSLEECNTKRDDLLKKLKERINGKENKEESAS